MMRPIRVRTQQREVYEKFAMLNYCDKVVLENANSKETDRLLSNINKRESFIEWQKKANNIHITRKQPLRINVYWKKY